MSEDAIRGENDETSKPLEDVINDLLDGNQQEKVFPVSKEKKTIRLHDEKVRIEDVIKMMKTTNTINLKIDLSYTMLWFLGSSLVFAYTVILLHGFKHNSFQLEESFINWLGIATIGEIGSLLVIVYKSIFRND